MGYIPVVHNLGEASICPQLLPARLGNPQAILTLVCELPCALVQTPQAGCEGSCGLIDQQEAAISQGVVDVGQSLCKAEAKFLSAS